MAFFLSYDPLPPVAPGQKQAEDALSTIAGQGILGALCVLLIVALFLSITGWLKSKDERLEDQKEMGKALKEMNEASSKLAIESNRASDGMKTALDNLAKSNKDLEIKVNDMEKQQVQLVAAMPAKR
jgi:uncharacterized protein HemX